MSKKRQASARELRVLKEVQELNRIARAEQEAMEKGSGKKRRYVLMYIDYKAEVREALRAYIPSQHNKEASKTNKDNKFTKGCINDTLLLLELIIERKFNYHEGGVNPREAKEDGFCWLDQAEIAEALDISVNKVRAGVRALAYCGFLAVTCQAMNKNENPKGKVSHGYAVLDKPNPSFTRAVYAEFIEPTRKQKKSEPVSQKVDAVGNKVIPFKPREATKLPSYYFDDDEDVFAQNPPMDLPIDEIPF